MVKSFKSSKRVEYNMLIKAFTFRFSFSKKRFSTYRSMYQ